MFRRAALALSLALLCGVLPAAARPLRLDDLLGMRDFEAATVDPTGRWLLLEVAAPYRRASSFENIYLSRFARSRLYRVDLHHPQPPQPAFAQTAGGYIAGPWSPSGRQVVVFRHWLGRREAGVLTLASGRVRWLGLSMELEDDGPTLAWRSERELLALALAPGDATLQARDVLGAMLASPRLWAASLAGTGVSERREGSGRYLAEHAEEPPRRLVRIDVASGRSDTLAQGRFETLQMSPDGQRLALVCAGGRVQPPVDRLITPQFPSRRHNLLLFDLPGRRESALPSALDVDPQSARWSAAGALLFAAVDPDRPEAAPRLWRVARGTREAVELPLRDAGEPLSLAGAPAHLDWMGETPIVFAEVPGGRGDWYRLSAGQTIRLTAALDHPADRLEALGEDALLVSEAPPRAGRGDGALWRITRDGQAVRLLAGPGLDIIRPTIADRTGPTAADSPGQRPGAWVFAGGGRSTLVHAGLSGALQSFPLEGVGEASDARGSPSRLPVAGAFGALQVSVDVQGVTRIRLLARSAPPRLLMTLNAHLGAADWSVPMPLDHLGPKGEPERDWLYLPSQGWRRRERLGSRPLDAGRPGIRAPLLVMGYPGATSPAAPIEGAPGYAYLDDNPQLAAAHGYAVLVPSLPRAGVDLNDTMTGQVLAAIHRAAARPEVDAARAGFWGHSAGGWLGLKLATETPVFKAIVAAAAPSDLISDRGQVPPAFNLGPDWDEGERYPVGWSERGQGGLNATPYSDLRHYLKASPLFQAERITTPILLVQGDQDPVPFTQGEEMFSALYRLRKDALSLLFFGEGHSISSPPNMTRYVDAVFDFLGRELGSPDVGAPPGTATHPASSECVSPRPAETPHPPPGSIDRAARRRRILQDPGQWSGGEGRSNASSDAALTPKRSTRTGASQRASRLRLAGPTPHPSAPG